MAVLSLRTLPPYAEISVVEKTITRDNFGGNYIVYPYNWTAGFNAGVTDYSASTTKPYNYPAGELLDQYKSVSEMRTFYPDANRIWNPTQGIGSLNMAYFLKMLDFWYGKTNDSGNPLKMMWIPGVYNSNGANQVIWAGYNQDTAAGEQALVDFWEAIFGSYASTTSNDIGVGAKTFTIATGLLITTANHVRIFQTSNPANFMWGNVTGYTSGTGALVVNVTNTGGSGTGITDWSVAYCSPTGYTINTHPGLASIEMANESVKSTSVVTAFARACRITYKLVKKYKSACKVIQVSSSNGSEYFAQMLVGSAVSLIPLATDGDDGTGKQACDYIADGLSHHPYISGNTSAISRYAAIANNSFGSTVIRANLGRNNGAFSVVTKWNHSSNKFGTDPNSIPLWVTESGPMLIPVAPNSGGWVSFMASQKEKFNNLIRWALPQLMTTRDGAGGIGKFFFYAFDGSGYSGGQTGVTGSTGTITATTVAAHTNGCVKITLSGAPTIPFSSTVLDESIVITAGTGGWSDLGLLAGEKKRFTMSVVSGNTMYLQDTVYTAQPANNATYSEFQMDWSPFPEELKLFVDLLISGLVSFGWINYPGAARGHWFNVKGVGTWYTTSTGEVRQW